MQAIFEKKAPRPITFGELEAKSCFIYVYEAERNLLSRDTHLKAKLYTPTKARVGADLTAIDLRDMRIFRCNANTLVFPILDAKITVGY